MKSQVSHIVVMVIALIISGLLAAKIHTKQKEIDSAYDKVSKAPLAGMHKFASDVQWMRFINYCGSQKSVNEENLPKIIEKLEELISLDPNFEKSYSVGVQMIAVESPNKAVALLEKACEVEKLKKNWRIPFYAAFILTHHIKPPNYKKAAEFLEKAIQRSGTPEKYLVNALVRAKAHIALEKGKAFDGTPLNNIEEAKLMTLFKEWQTMQGQPFDGEYYSNIPDLSERLLEAAKRAKMQSPGNKNILVVVDKVREKIGRGQAISTAYLTPEEIKLREKEIADQKKAEQEKFINEVVAKLGSKLSAGGGKIDTNKITAEISKKIDSKLDAAIKKINEAQKQAIDNIKKAEQK